MKFSKSAILFSLSCITPLISGCFSSYPRPITPGEFQYSQDEHSMRVMIIHPITESEFNLANGLNVVEDISKNKTNNYYSLDYYLIENDIKTSFNFINLKDNPRMAFKPGHGFSYQDENGLLIRLFDDNNEIRIDHGNYEQYILRKTN